jgi:integrase
VPIPHELALVLSRHKQSAVDVRPDSFVFATRSGRPLGQRNVARALRKAQQRAIDKDGQPTFPVLHLTDAGGSPIPAPPGSVPSMHSFRHTVASLALLAGESVDEVAFLLGHRDATLSFRLPNRSHAERSNDGGNAAAGDYKRSPPSAMRSAPLYSAVMRERRMRRRRASATSRT